MIFMKNKKIIDSWNSIAPDEASEKRMLQAILDKNHNAEYKDQPDEDEFTEIITDEYTVSKGKTAKQILLTALPAAACVALIFGIVKYTSDNLPAGDKNDEINISVGETSATVISDITRSEMETDSPVTPVSEIITITEVPINSDTKISATSSIITTAETSKASAINTAAGTETPKDDKKEYTDTKPAQTEPETDINAETPKTQKVTDQKFITTTVTTEPKPRETVAEMTTVAEVTTIPEVKRLITKDEVIELSKKGDSLKISDLKSFEFEDIGSGIFILRYPIEDTDYALCLFYSRSWLDESQTPNRTAIVRMNSYDLKGIDIRESTPEQILAELDGTAQYSTTEATSVFTEITDQLKNNQ